MLRTTMQHINDKIKALEISLHQPHIRSDHESITTLLHPDFKEIGYSGKTYHLKASLKALLAENSSASIWSQSFEYFELASGWKHRAAYNCISIKRPHVLRLKRNLPEQVSAFVGDAKQFLRTQN